MDGNNKKYDYEDELISNLHDYEYMEMLEKADNVVLGFVTTTGATGAIPIPFADAPLIIGQQVAMMAAINAIFKIDINKDALKSLVLAALGVSGATVLGRTIVANALKFIPIKGSIVGGVISAATAGIITLALGKAYILICQQIKMGKLNQDDLSNKAGIDALKEAFREQMKKGKKK